MSSECDALISPTGFWRVVRLDHYVLAHEDDADLLAATQSTLDALAWCEQHAYGHAALTAVARSSTRSSPRFRHETAQLSASSCGTTSLSRSRPEQLYRVGRDALRPIPSGPGDHGLRAAGPQAVMPGSGLRRLDNWYADAVRWTQRSGLRKEVVRHSNGRSLRCLTSSLCTYVPELN